MIVEINYGEYIDLEDEFISNEDLWTYVESLVNDNVIYGTKIA